jgi:dipeptidyl aminopeptidase/acylaminoacyl peptidase
MPTLGRAVPLLAGAVLHLGSPATPPAAGQAPRPLAVDWIMRGPELVGREPSEVRWSPDSRWIYFRWLEPGASWREPLRPYRVRAAPGAAPEELTLAAWDSVAPALAAGPTSRDGKRRVTSVGGDLYLVELPSGTVRRLTDTPVAAESDPSFDAAGTRVFFRRDLNLFGFDLQTLAVRQLTDIRAGPAPDSARKAEGQRAALEREERALIAAVRDRLWRDSLERAQREAREAARPKPLHLDRGEQVARLVPSPTGRHALILTATPGEPRRTQVPAYVTTSGYTEPLDVRSKVGDQQGRQRVGMLTLATGAVRWLRPLAGDSSDRYASLADRGWNDAGTAALLDAVPSDRSSRHLLRVDADSAAVRPLEVLRDSAWVGGPCFGCAGWLPGDRGIWVVSEADGFAHLYTLAPDGSRREQRTRGSWEVLDAELSPGRSSWLLHTSEPSPFERQSYVLPVDGGPARRLTREVGGHSVVLSPDGAWLADVFSTSDRPPELFLQAARLDAARARLTLSPTAEWLAFPWIIPEIRWIPASDGVKVPARLYQPGSLGAAPNGAAVIFVHGAGYLHNVHSYWSSYYREYMFHHLLAQQGFHVLDLDYRASAGYGRDWRTAIYRHMGGRDLQDQVDGARYLQSEFGIDFDRIGIYGGSYGGFITLMALFTEGRYFGAGAALRSVTDWAHYNHPYTANILNEPQDDSLAYRRSSPIYFAEGLADPLLMAHGMVDVNVHFQDIVRLSQRLIELGKTNWELAVYPVEDHGFVRPDSWTDEYRRILELFQRWLVARP